MIHFDLNINIDCDHLTKAINSLVNKYIKVNYCEEVSDDFHARFDTKYKVYQYVINLGEYDPIDEDFIYNYNHTHPCV